MSLLFPVDKKKAVPVRVLETNKSTAPTFVAGLADLNHFAAEPLIKIVDIGDAQDEVNAAPALKHSLDLLDQGDPQRSRFH